MKLPILQGKIEHVPATLSHSRDLYIKCDF